MLNFSTAGKKAKSISFMGIIQRQGIKHSIAQYAGVSIGVLSTLYLYPKVLEAYGLTQALFAAAFFIAPMASLGTYVLSIRFFPDFKNSKNGNNGFLGLMLLISFTGFAVFYLLFPYIQELILDYFLKPEKSPWYAEFLPYVLPLTFFIMLNRVLAIYASNFQRIVVPSILEEFLLKITLPILLVLFLWEKISINWVINGIVLNYAFATLGILIYLWTLGTLSKSDLKPRFGFLSKKMIKKMSSYAGYGVVSAVGQQSAFKIDTLMVSNINFESAGVFGMSNFMSEAMSKPQKSVIGIASPLISKAMKEKDLEEVEMIYKKSSITLLIIGLFLFTGLWACLDDLIAIMDKPEMEAAKYPILFLCMARLFNMATGLNTDVINYSKYFRFNFYMILALAFLNISMNIFFIIVLDFGILGAALATFISFTIYNTAKLLFIKWKFGFQPFSKKTVIVLGIGILVSGIVYLFPDIGNPYLNILIQGGFVALTFPILTFKLKISEDFNSLISNFLKKYAPKLLNYLE